ncbi:glyoxalase [Mesorhizobium tianshanense]|uniref:Glyoxalase/bleomycin resistance protein/dioxygenase superfamily protein n=1 Tax=Mesorhizobium tianshanense TaxID=39844 RepID=A0A562P2X2_9HYPH|nr:VOC family protein [Mesorhizobium tianshanense]TWI38818.1 glyoxalase/bleomycin resistance protein/dioxygenase superfamily protein [Mesorhizobium tianshanense]GLS38150.1 glyoxalase [Mesorhizobium tianshanense]
MEKVLGIGGFFFRAKEPGALARWYADHLGVALPPESYDRSWEQQQGATVFAPFAATSDYLGRVDQQWMINFRVRDLQAMVAQLTAAGLEVEVGPEHYPNGRFARLADPEGNPIQLWHAEGADRD